jgi:hypothetical protein
MRDNPLTSSEFNIHQEKVSKALSARVRGPVPVNFLPQSRIDANFRQKDYWQALLAD